MTLTLLIIQLAFRLIPVPLDESAYTWERLAAEAPFPKSYNFQLFSDDTTIRAFHGQGVWESADGKNWRKSPLSNIIVNQAFLDYVFFNNQIYGLGTFQGNIERFTQSTQIARTSDYRSWNIVARESNLPKRFFYHPFVFRNKIWIIGGSDGTRSYDDAWNSDDAVHWKKAAESLPFGERSGQQFVIFRDTLYMLDRDVWRSTDALHWEPVIARIAEGEIFGYSAIVFDGRIWLIGCNRNGKFSSEVLSSSDGKNWTSTSAPWSPRGGAATWVFRNSIIMTGGKYGGQDISHPEFVYSNDVWQLKRR